MRGRCCDCEKFRLDRKKTYKNTEYYFCDAVVEAMIPEETVYREAECRFFKSIYRDQKGSVDDSIKF